MKAALDYGLVAMFGVLVGASELVSRYRDAPWSAIKNPASAAYVSVNAIAAAATLALLRIFDVTFDIPDATGQRAVQVLVSGFGAIAVLRTSLFIVQVGGRDVGVGPATLLHVLLFATDRDVDRRRAKQRAKAVSDALRGLSYTDVGEALPNYYLTLMQNVPDSEQAELRQRLKEIADSTMEDALKVNAVGLTLMTVVGQRVLEAAADTARTRLLERGVLGEVYPRLREAIDRVTRPDDRVLDVLGLTLYTAWPNVRAWLDDHTCLLDGWTIRMRMVDPDILAGPLRHWFDPHWLDEVRGVLEDVRRYVVENEESLERRGVKLTITTYALVPVVHGFRTGGGTYFISFGRWDDKTGELGRPYQSYEYLPPDDHSPRTCQYKAIFDNWLRRADQVPPTSSGSLMARDNQSVATEATAH
ncbi:hypothetical protein SAMN06893096_1107 [Geodermatophilus pulveris]|uniref:Uncharacterized protein n=1 Tax=Geodermatophilus pulveris TaxID=1564159 RepID=A0A239I6J1_9ACTN|nr:hypothetical protein [Geodermatophilus pulveris]SNS89002.1 hypothetical protein SAMN06893096_1107 [Geodermatophilus pulveris]